MKKILTLVLTIASAMQIGAQVINENYQDGKIWLKLKQVQPQDANSNGVVKKTAAVTSVKAIASLNDEVKVNSVELPFTVAKDARISSIYQVYIK